MNREDIKTLINNFEYIERFESDIRKEIKEYIREIQQENQSLKNNLNELEEENFNLRENIYIEKMSFPSNGRNIKELIEMPTYEELQQENQKLKERLEEERNKVREYSYKLSNFRCEETYENQQKEFISYLENEILELKKISTSTLEERLGKDYLIIQKEEILSKYKEIIGDKNG